MQALVLGVGVDVSQLGQIAERGADRRLPLSEQRKIVRLQGVLVLRIAGSTTGAQVLRRLQEQRCTCHLRQLRPQPVADFVCRCSALLQWFQHHKHEARIALPATGERGDVGYGRVFLHNFDKLRHLAAHRLERRRLIGLNATNHQAGILLRKEALGNFAVEPDVGGNGQGEHDQQQGGMIERPAQ